MGRFFNLTLFLLSASSVLGQIPSVCYIYHLRVYTDELMHVIELRGGY